MRSVLFLFFALYLITTAVAMVFNFLNLQVFLYLYLLVAAIFAIFTFFNLYHAWLFGTWNLVNFIMIFLYIVVLATIAFMSYNFINSVDWSQSVNILL